MKHRFHYCLANGDCLDFAYFSDNGPFGWRGQLDAGPISFRSRVGRVQRAPPILGNSWWGSLRSTHPTALSRLKH
jgi:hypothetical protein